MKAFSFELMDGITSERNGEIIVRRRIEFKQLTAGEVFAAQDKAEDMKLTPNGYELLTSPAKLSRELVRLSVKKIDDDIGMGEAEMRKLSDRDWSLMMAKYEEFTALQNALLEKRLKDSEQMGKQ